jgi:DNA repair protein RadC
MGSNNAVVAPTQLLFHTALSLGANGIFVFHNHPSGSMEFSLPDKKLSKDIAKGAEYLLINYIDFVVITSDGLSNRFMDYYSARENEPDLLQR